MKSTLDDLVLAANGPSDTVTARVHRPARPKGPAALLTHGAGGDLDDAGLTALAELLAARGNLAVRTNLPYREAGRRSPPKAESSVEGLAAIFASARDQVGPRRAWIGGGKSYGGRVASLAVADDLPLEALIFYGYPLHPPGRPDRLRVDHWPHIDAPCLFLQGTRDPFCDLELLDANLRKLPRRATVHIVEGGDHSLRVTGKASPDGRPRSPAAMVSELAPVVAAWLDDLGRTGLASG